MTSTSTSVYLCSGNTSEVHAMDNLGETSENTLTLEIYLVSCHFFMTSPLYKLWTFCANLTVFILFRSLLYSVFRPLSLCAPCYWQFRRHPKVGLDWVVSPKQWPRAKRQTFTRRAGDIAFDDVPHYQMTDGWWTCLDRWRRSCKMPSLLATWQTFGHIIACKKFKGS